jgi:hydrogenase maturation protease
LVLGYGNTLRGDDGVGVQVAEVVAAWHQPQIKTLTVHQLTPDLAAAIAPFPRVIFVDAAADHPVVRLTTLTLSRRETFTTHIASPTALLALAQRLYDATPIAYLLTIPGVNFELGEELSAIATAGKVQALKQLRELCSGDVENGSRRLGAALAEPNGIRTDVGFHSVSPNRPTEAGRQISAAPRPPILGVLEHSHRVETPAQGTASMARKRGSDHA